MVLLEEANHAIGLVDLHMTVGLWSLCDEGGAGSFMQVKELIEETAGQGDNREGERGDQASYLNRFQLGEGDRRSAAFPSRKRGTRFGE